MIFYNRDDETTTEGAESTELVELEAPPAPPTRLDPSTVEGEELATEEGEAQSTPPSSVTIRERMAQLADRPSSPGFGVVGKFDGARADYTAQDNE